MKKLTQIMLVFTENIGRVIASGYAMKHCIPFLQTGYMDALDWIAVNGIQYKYVYAINWELRDKWMENLANEIDAQSDDDSAEISDEKHYAEMRKFFNENVKDLEFNSMFPYCSQCGKKDPVYVGLMRCFQRPSPLVFAFCIDCRDELVRRADAAKQSQERFGV